MCSLYVLMGKNGAITFSDIAGTQTMLHVVCEKCGRAGRYQVPRLTRERGPDSTFISFLKDLTRHCPKRNSTSIYDRCGATFHRPR